MSFVIDQPITPPDFFKYNVEITHEWETSRGCGFTGDVIYGNDSVFSFENLGDGGCNKYLAFDERSKKALDEFFKLCKENYPQHSDSADYALIYLELRNQLEE